MPARVSTADEILRTRAAAVRKQFVASGTNVSEWARERRLSLKLVHQVLRGERSCRRGESHRIAVALGIKDEAPAPGEALPRTPSRTGVAYPDDLVPAR